MGKKPNKPLVANNNPQPPPPSQQPVLSTDLAYLQAIFSVNDPVKINLMRENEELRHKLSQYEQHISAHLVSIIEKNIEIDELKKMNAELRQRLGQWRPKINN